MQGFPHLTVHEMKEDVHEISSGINDMLREERRGLNNRHGKQLFAIRSVVLRILVHVLHVVANWLSSEIIGNGFGIDLTMLPGNGWASEHVGPMGTGRSTFGTARFPGLHNPGGGRS